MKRMQISLHFSRRDIFTNYYNIFTNIYSEIFVIRSLILTFIISFFGIFNIRGSGGKIVELINPYIRVADLMLKHASHVTLPFCTGNE